MKPKTINLEEGESIIAVVPEVCSGPGWSNTPVWVHIATGWDGKVRSECIQPEQQTAEMLILFHIGARVCNDLKGAVPVTMSKKVR